MRKTDRANTPTIVADDGKPEVFDLQGSLESALCPSVPAQGIPDWFSATQISELRTMETRDGRCVCAGFRPYNSSQKLKEKYSMGAQYLRIEIRAAKMWANLWLDS